MLKHRIDFTLKLVHYQQRRAILKCTLLLRNAHTIITHCFIYSTRGVIKESDPENTVSYLAPPLRLNAVFAKLVFAKSNLVIQRLCSTPLFVCFLLRLYFVWFFSCSVSCFFLVLYIQSISCRIRHLYAFTYLHLHLHFLHILLFSSIVKKYLAIDSRNI